MKTEDLQAKGLSQDQIDYVMAEYGKDINGIKQERDNYKTQLSTAQATLKSFEGVNVSELQGKIAYGGHGDQRIGISETACGS